MDIVWDERGGATIVLDGHPQSYVDPDDPGLLVFEYVQHFSLVLETLRPDPAPLAVTHVGGAGMTLARWVHATYPGSPQIVLEPDADLTDLVRRELPLPRGHRIRVRPVTGEAGIGALRDASADVVVVDAYAAGRVPAGLTSPGWAAEVARVLRPDGLLLMNAPDRPGLRWVARLGETLRAELPHLGRMLLREIASGKRYGNCVLVASPRPLDDLALTRAAARADFPTVWQPADLVRRLAGGAQPLDESGEASPEPPATGLLRLR